MLNLKLSPQAIIDIEDIYEFTFITWGIKQAEKYQDELYEGMLLISEKSEIGSVYYFKKGNYRKLLINRHLIFYSTIINDCIIIRILHERMDLDAVL